MLEPTKNYPFEAGAKVSGPSTEAAESMRGKAPTLRALILKTLKTSPLARMGWTADEMAEFLDETVLAVRPRFSELLELGEIKDSGTRRKNSSGRAATVWLAVLVGDQHKLF